MDSDSREFLAGRRCFYANGEPFLVLFGLSPHNGKNHDVLETVLTKSNVQLGDFLTASLTPQNTLKEFKRISYPINVTVEKNFALMKFPSAEATRDENGVLIFKTKSFGPVRSLIQDLPIGCYEIVIKAIDSTTNYNIILCAEAVATAKSPSPVNNAPLSNFYEVVRNKLPLYNIFSRQVENSQLPVPSLSSNIPKPTSHSSNQYDYVVSNAQLDIPNSLSSSNLDRPTNTSEHYYMELQNCFSGDSNVSLNRNTSDTEPSLEELIEKLPKVDIKQTEPPTPLPRTITPVPKAKAKIPPKPILKVQPNKGPIINQNSPATPEPVRNMKAFVHSVLQHPDMRIHFLWICDIMQKSVLKLPNHELQIGHFFEGVFEKLPNGEWKCISYEKPLTKFIKGSIVNGRIELTTTISNYQSATADYKYPQAYAKHLGVVIDRKSVLPLNCNGRRVKIQRLKIDGDKYEWVITELA